MNLRKLNEELKKFMNEISDEMVNRVTSRRLDRLVASRNKNMKDMLNGNNPDKSTKDYERAESKLANHYKLKSNRKSNPTLTNIKDNNSVKDSSDNILNKIINLGFNNVTGPKQKENDTIMLKGTKSGRGYRIVLQGKEYTAYSLNNFGIGKSGAETDNNYRLNKELCKGTKEDCLNKVLDDAEKHLNRI